MAAHAQVAFDENGLRHKRGQEGGCDGEQDIRRCAGSEPDDSGGGGAEAKDCLERLANLVGQIPQAVNDVAALGHIGGEAAVKVAVGDSWNFAEESQPEAVFDLPSETDGAGEEGNFEEQQSGAEDQDGGDGAEALTGDVKAAGDVENATQEDGLNQDAAGSQGE